PPPVEWPTCMAFFRSRCAVTAGRGDLTRTPVRLSTRFRRSMLSLSHENQLERCPQVSVRRIFCYGRGELVFFLAWHERSFSFFRIFSYDTGILVFSRFHTFRPVSDLLVFRVHQKMIWRKSATSRRRKPRVGTCHRAQ